MSKLKFSFLVLMLMVSVSASADWAPADVQAALKKMYPTADDVAWSHDESYYVADFLMNGFDTKVWFDGQAQWRFIKYTPQLTEHLGGVLAAVVTSSFLFFFKIFHF